MLLLLPFTTCILCAAMLDCTQQTRRASACMRNSAGVFCPEAIEVDTRTQLAYHFARLHEPFSYHDPAKLPNLRPDSFLLWQRKLDDQVQRSLRSKEEFLVHFFKHYGDEHSRPPIWILIELMDFGSTLTFYRGSHHFIKQNIAKRVAIPDRVFSSWLPSDWLDHPLWKTSP